MDSLALVAMLRGKKTQAVGLGGPPTQYLWLFEKLTLMASRKLCIGHANGCFLSRRIHRTYRPPRHSHHRKL